MNASTDTKQRIVSTAGQLIAARSYADVGVAEICKEAGVKKGSFYHFFPSKRDLTLAVLDATFVDFKESLLDKAFSPRLDPLQRIPLLASMVYDYQAAIATETGFVPGCPFGNMAAEQATQDEDLRQKVQVLFNRFSKAIRQTLEQGVENNDLPANLDTAASADAMLAYAEGVMLLAKTRNDASVIRDLLPAMAEVRIFQQ